MGNPNHHLMRVRIRKAIFNKLQDLATEETRRTGQNVTVSDLVRAACYNYLLQFESLYRLENLPPPNIEEEVLVITNPML
jgi:hypothetical protein